VDDKAVEQVEQRSLCGAPMVVRKIRYFSNDVLHLGADVLEQ
jgi:hypothetical protein